MEDTMKYDYGYLHHIGRIPFNQQITNFQSTLNQITADLGADNVAGAIADCIFFVGMGSNDYLNNYLMPNYNSRNIYNPYNTRNIYNSYNTRNIYNSDQFSTLLVQQDFIISARGNLFYREWNHWAAYRTFWLRAC